MKRLFRQFMMLSKRILCKPIYIIILGLLGLIPIISHFIPDKSMDSNVLTAYFVSEDSEYMEELENLLSSHEDGFTFVKCHSLSELKSGVGSGKYDCGYFFQKDFTQNIANASDTPAVTLFISPSTLFDTVSQEIIFEDILTAYSPAILDEYLKNNATTGPAYDKDWSDFVHETYHNYISGNEIFTITTNSSKNSQKKIAVSNFTFPVAGLTGFIIFLSSLMGLLTYLNDDNQKIYGRLKPLEKFEFLCMNILASTVPASIIGTIALLIYGTNHSVIYVILWNLVYIIICLLFCLLYKLVFVNYKLYLSALPLLITCTLILSPIFIDLSRIRPFFKVLSYLFPTSFYL